MGQTLKSISYSFVAGIEQPYKLDIVVIENGILLVDVHQSFEQEKTFLTAVKEVIPILEEKVSKTSGMIG